MSDEPTQLILIRHGHASANGGDMDAPMAGWTDVGLSARGRLEIEQLRVHLTLQPRFDAIYSSPLLRARKTAESLASTGLGPLYVSPALKEIYCGEVDGLAVNEVQRRFPDLWSENLLQIHEDFRWPGGESYREFRGRCINAVQAIAARHALGRVAIVTHAGVISQIMGSIHGLSPARWEPFRPGNASISELVWSNSSLAVVAFDCRAHLESLNL